MTPGGPDRRIGAAAHATEAGRAQAAATRIIARTACGYSRLASAGVRTAAEIAIST